jgi:putative spermidine/putrescine transport system permease protein
MDLRRFLAALPWLLPMAILSTGLFVGPLAVLVGMSFTSPPPAQGLTLDTYAAFLGDGFNLAVLADTVLLGLKVVATTTLLGVPVAVAWLHAGPRVQALILLATLLPMLTSNVVRTFAWIVILGREGLLNMTLQGLGLATQPVRLLFTEPGLVLALTQIELPLLVLPLIAVLGRLDRSMLDAAAALGAGPWRILVSVILPRAVTGLIAGWILVFASATTSFVAQAVIGGARLIYLPLFVYQQVGTLFNWPKAAAVAVILLLTTGVVLVALTLIARHPRVTADG